MENKICYAKNYITEVIAKLDFNPVKALDGDILPKDIQKVIKERYPIYEPIKGIMQNVAINKQGFSSNRTEFPQWVYRDENREKSITISSYGILVHLLKYKSYKDLKDDIIKPIHAVMGLDNNITVRRTGLRFVNIFNDVVKNFGDIAKYFEKMIAGPFDQLIDEKSCARSFLMTEYVFDDLKLRLQTGIYNPDYPAKIKNKEFIIDIDAYIDIPHIISDINDFFDDLHNHIGEKFEQCIKEKLREAMRNEH